MLPAVSEELHHDGRKRMLLVNERNRPMTVSRAGAKR
jgi:hypothetical protein